MSFNLSDFTTFTGVFHWVLMHGYWVILVAMLFEGPIVTSAAAFAVSLGYFNFFIIFILAILGDLIADVAYYAIGYWGRITLVEWFGHKIGLSNERLERIGKLVKDHPWKILFALKMTPIIPTTGLMAVGTTKMPIRKFAFICTIVILPRALFFMLLGYYFGRIYDQVNGYLVNGTYILIAIVVIIIIADRLFRKYFSRLAAKVQKF